jgi:1-deoxy-D-xylulose-5-phosphate reductoisomerase
MQNLTILGSTGSIGCSTLDVVRGQKGSYRVYALAVGWNVETLAAQVEEFRPQVAVVATPQVLRSLTKKLEESSLRRPDWPELLCGPEAKVAVATASEVNVVISAIVGVAGLEATYRAVQSGKKIGLANKEVLVAGGELVMDAVRASGAEVIPVDSEHNGAHQCLKAGRREEVRRLILTASGGPFRATAIEAMARVTPEEALNHPTWKMGRRITIDSATMMNKGFEVIEACWLFGLRPDEVDVVVHPQSSVHAMVEYNDGSIIAQVSVTDMRMPIQYALTYPERLDAPVARYDWTRHHSWDFEPPDLDKFPLLRLAYRAQEAGGAATCILNAADEVGVEAFLDGRLPFLGIAEIAEETLERMPGRQAASVEEVLDIDEEARRMAGELVAARTGLGEPAQPMQRGLG